MARTTAVLLLLLCQFEISSQTCNECERCEGDNACDTDKKCINGCIAGYWGDECRKSCPANCKTCVSDLNCTECHPGYFSVQCAFQCGKGCVSNTCLQSGECTCKSSDFSEGYCNTCSSSNKYGDECNYSCPPNCGGCESQTECRWCKYSAFYGSYCQFMCSIGCVKGTCMKDDGTCHSGCKSGFRGNKCDSCVSGKYGPKCDLDCPSHCISCLSNSNCTECKIGYRGKTCTDICAPGCYGICSIYSGQCMECKQGLYGDICNNTKTCEDGKYGINCSNECKNVDQFCLKCFASESGMYGGCLNCASGHYPIVPNGVNYSLCTSCPGECKDNVCNSTGLCSYGCFLGKWGGTCNSDCESNCLECNQSDGKCIKCRTGTYSEDCSILCSTNCSTTDSERICELHTGVCINGCSLNRKYGNFCEHQCNDRCINQTCNWKTGQCLHGCVENYYGSICDNECASTCKSVKKKRSCNDSTGYCISGCENGFHGNMCERKCSGTCVNETCHQVTAECLYGCIEGYDGLQCTQATTRVQQECITTGELIGIVFGSVLIGLLIGGALTVVFIIWKRRNTKPRGESNQQTVDNYDNNIPVTYEDLKERDERTYSQITSNKQLSPQAAEYVNC
ncbi:multiple epidermal growth factor-like domains protein 11 [Mercenaria mercenaria]|uniref:multiple epidermal growth factor-like domains protein 11 n=1 Tax=Mercenaria mercenaria TaxID=6596 RepID=UPI00234E7440|nr:multiple epidermal growth factor-like domains protein 11 [Mercenaria mercenaria]